jgi:hypothetical protein
MIIFQDKHPRNNRILGSTIIATAKHWCQIKGEGYIDNFHLILSTNVDSLSLQITKLNLRIMPKRKETCQSLTCTN